MKEYIERAVVKEKILSWAVCINHPELLSKEDTMYCINSLPAADVAEVRHGRWVGIEYDGYADGCPVYDLWECSECGEEVRGEDVPDTHPWCHACGARMDKEDEHEVSE